MDTFYGHICEQVLNHRVRCVWGIVVEIFCHQKHSNCKWIKHECNAPFMIYKKNCTYVCLRCLIVETSNFLFLNLQNSEKVDCWSFKHFLYWQNRRWFFYYVGWDLSSRSINRGRLLHKNWRGVRETIGNGYGIRYMGRNIIWKMDLRAGWGLLQVEWGWLQARLDGDCCRLDEAIL